MKYRYLLFLLLLPLLQYCGTTRTATAELPQEDVVRIMFYNVENLFDTINDPDKNDEDFLPDGRYNWGSYRYHKKLKDISKVVVNLGGFEVPALLGLVEIENRAVLEDLVKKTPLYKFEYGIIHEESPDERGIDVALLYRKDIFKPLGHEAIRIRFPKDQEDNTRDILYATGTVGSDTLHIFVNHWPSRRGGQEASEPKRVIAAQHLRSYTDSLFRNNASAKIVIMGDFNDMPDNRSIAQVLDAKGDTSELSHTGLYNGMYGFEKQGIGTYKYQQNWNLLDQIIISSGLLRADQKLSARPGDIHIVQAEWLMEEDQRFPGKKPFRTYLGPRYIGGYSDHLPVYIDLKYKQ